MATPLQPLAILRSDKDVDWIGAMAQNAGANANLAGLPGNDGIIESIAILSDQQLAWEVQLYSSDAFDNADLDLDTYLGSVRFAEGDGFQVAGAGAFRYDIHHLGIPYMDVDGTREIHAKLVNRSATGKNAGAAGEIVVKFSFRAQRTEV